TRPCITVQARHTMVTT
nr:immunoglobulin heavy chain junction region [Mus musculus]